MRFCINIGDVWDDGHGKYEVFHVEGDVTQEDITKSLLTFREATGFDVSEICTKYEEHHPTEEQVEAITEYLSQDYVDVCGPDLFTDMVVDIINKGLSTKKMLSIIEDKAPSITFPNCRKYADGKLRSTDQIGYGQFY